MASDDIPLGKPSSQTEQAIPSKNDGPRRTAGPESEVRGGPEATEEPLDDARPQRPRR